MRTGFAYSFPAFTVLTVICVVQSAYFALTGVWPIVHIRSFMAVTGPKTDLWLVRTVGVLITVIAVALGVSALRHAIDVETATLAIGSALSLAAVDVIYVARGTIAKIYLLDAAAEAVLIVAWVVGLFMRN